MAKTFWIHVNPKIIKWSIEHGERGEEARTKFSVNKWIKPQKKQDNPTFNQLKAYSHYIHLPFSYFLGNEIPKEKNSFVKFRTINNKRAIPTRRLIDTIDDMTSKQEWMKNYLLSQNNNYIFNYLNYISKKDSVMKASKKVSKLLDISNIRKAFHQDADFFNSIRKKISSLGIIIMQDGVVGNNTHRKLHVKDFRAFALVDKILPLIFINSADSKKAKIFSLIHELIHILVGKNEILNVSQNQLHKIHHEQWINSVTINILLPKNELLKYFGGSPKDDSIAISNDFHVSLLATSIRMKDLGEDYSNENLINWARHIQTININNKKKSQGGNYYNTIPSRVDKHFAKAVINEEASGKISLLTASDMLGTSVSKYKPIVNKILELR